MAVIKGKKEITKKSDNISRWYTDVVLKAKLADYGPAKGSMVIRPYGYAVWEKVQQAFNQMIGEYGVENAYFPMFIPHSLLEKEQAHVEGFSPELAVVTHGGGKKLAEPLVVRPTSETIMYEMFSKWIHSWRDLPLKINQWCNVVRWELRTYLFLRTTEFLWQEGHTAHATKAEAVEMQEKALEWYRRIHEEYYAVPVIRGYKSESEKFAGADTTYAVESLMPDGKALQSATSHLLGQNFSKPFDINFSTKDGKTDFVWQTSWGLSTRSIGGLILAHGDDAGMVMPPMVAPIKAVIVPLLGKESKKVEGAVKKIKEEIEAKKTKFSGKIEVWDEEGKSMGWKLNEAELKGIPVAIVIGGREVDEGKVDLKFRVGESKKVGLRDIAQELEKGLEDYQNFLFNKQQEFVKVNTFKVETYDDFQLRMKDSRGFIHAFWCENKDCESKIKEETKATTRVKEFNEKESSGKCIKCGKEAKYRWVFAQAY